jgi:protein TonB
MPELVGESRGIDRATVQGRAPARLGAALSLAGHAAGLCLLLFAMTAPSQPAPSEALATIDFVAAPPDPVSEPAPEPAPEPVSHPAPRPVPVPEPPPPEKVTPAAEPAAAKPPPENRVLPAKPKHAVRTPKKPDVVRPEPHPVAPTPVAASVAPAAAPVAAPVRDDALRDYGNRVWALVFRHKPAHTLARGTTRVTFSLSEQGDLLGLAVSQSSGLATLDQAALNAVRAASPFPPPPAGITAEQRTFSVAFDFR